MTEVCGIHGRGQGFASQPVLSTRDDAGRMTSRTVRNRVSWLVPVATVGVVAVAALAPAASAAGEHPKLAPRSAAQLLVDLQSTTVEALSGTVVETARLGLPSLPGADRTASLDWQSLVTGTHTAQVWLDGPDRQRLALLGQLAESDVVHNGRDVWTYSSADGSVSHQVSGPEAATKGPVALPHGKDLKNYTPLGAAQAALQAIDPTTVVSVERTARVAGWPAYTLVLAPRDSHSTVRRVRIAMDASRHIPLRVQIFGAGKAPAFEIAFATLTYKTPAASVFRFRVPRGATLTDSPLGSVAGAGPVGKGEPSVSATPGSPTPRQAKPTVIGTGWTSVLELPAGASPFGPAQGSAPAAGAVRLPSTGVTKLAGPRAGGGPTISTRHHGGASVTDLVAKLTTTLPNGDKLLHTALLNAVMTADGRVFLGAVDPVMLEQIAAGHAG